MKYVKYDKSDIQVGATVEYNIYIMHTQTIHTGTVEEVLDSEVVVAVPGTDYLHRVKYEDIRLVRNPVTEEEAVTEKVVKVAPSNEVPYGNVIMEKRSHRERLRRKFEKKETAE